MNIDSNFGLEFRPIQLSAQQLLEVRDWVERAPRADGFAPFAQLEGGVVLGVEFAPAVKFGRFGVQDGAVKVKDQGAEHHRIVLRVPSLDRLAA